MNLRLRDVTDDDLPQIERWLRADHVRETWGDPETNSRLLREPPSDGHWRAVIEVDGRPPRADGAAAGLRRRRRSRAGGRDHP